MNKIVNFNQYVGQGVILVNLFLTKLTIIDHRYKVLLLYKLTCH